MLKHIDSLITQIDSVIANAPKLNWMTHQLIHHRDFLESFRHRYILFLENIPFNSRPL